MDLTRKEKSTSVIISCVFLILILLSIGYFANKYFGLFGQKIKINNPFSSKVSQNILTGSKTDNGYLFIPAQVLSAANARFTIDTGPKNIESITAKLKFKAGPKEIKLGVRGSELGSFVYQSFYQNMLQNCDWNNIEKNKLFLYQRNNNYNSLNQLVDNPPEKNKIASYFINRSSLFKKIFDKGLEQKNTEPINIKTGLRGTHSFIVRVEKLPFVFKLSKQDLNMYEGEDKSIVTIDKDGKVIEIKVIPDDGFTGKESLKKDSQTTEFKFDNIELGVYNIIAKDESIGNDIIITSIETNQAKMVIADKVFPLYDKPLTLYTKSSPIILRAVHKEFVQTVKLNDSISLDLNDSGKNYTFDLAKLLGATTSGELYKLQTPKTDVLFNNAGYFSFSPDQYFNPDVIETTDLNSTTSLEGIDYIITPVQKAKKDGDWLVSEVTFDASDINIDDKQKLYFSLEMPDLQKGSRGLEIQSFEVEVDVKGSLSGVVGKKQPTVFPTAISTVSPTPKTEPVKKGEIIQNIWNSIIRFFTNLWPFGKKSATITKPPPSPTVAQSGGQATPTATLTKTPTPTSTPTAVAGINKDIKITIFNSGAPAGYANKYTDLIKAAGYSSVTAGNARANLKDALITYPDKFKLDVSIIENILKVEYKNVVKTLNATSSGIVVNIGTL